MTVTDGDDLRLKEVHSRYFGKGLSRVFGFLRVPPAIRPVDPL